MMNQIDIYRSGQGYTDFLLSSSADDASLADVLTRFWLIAMPIRTFTPARSIQYTVGASAELNGALSGPRA